MGLNRRKFVALAAGGFAARLLAASSPAQIPGATTFKAVAFDAFPIFDPRPIFTLAEEMFPSRGQEIGNLWRTRQFEYTWLRTLTRQYVDFMQVTSDALIFVARTLNLELRTPERERLLDAYSRLKPWPDTRAALDRLRTAGVRLGLLSNFTRAMLETNIENSDLRGYFEQILSTDLAAAFKPDPRAYQLGPTAFKLPREQIVFAAFAGWDAAGAKGFGYPTFWVNRQHAPAEELMAPPDATGGIDDLVAFVLRGAKV